MNALAILLSGLTALSPVGEGVAAARAAAVVQLAGEVPPTKKQKELERRMREQRARQKRLEEERRTETGEEAGEAKTAEKTPVNEAARESETARRTETEQQKTEREKALESRVKTLEKKLEEKQQSERFATEDDIRAALIGATVQYDDPSGRGTVVWRFAKDGKVGGGVVDRAGNVVKDEDGDAIEDTGAWRVEGRKICIVWYDWLDGDMHCYAFRESGSAYYLAGKDTKYRVTGLQID